MIIPDNLQHLQRSSDGAAWLSRLPDLISSARDHFELKEMGRPFSGGSVSYVAPVLHKSGPAVLKVQYPHPECALEAAALTTWNGKGAVYLLDQAPEFHALLIERCLPGYSLGSALDTDRIGAISTLLQQLSIPGKQSFKDLRDEAKEWIEILEKNEAGFSDTVSLVEAAGGILRELIKDTWQPVLVHQDLHGDNILASERASWLAIDPKPISGDPAFALSPAVRSFELGHSKTEVFYRLDRLSEELDLDRERARLWTIGQTAAWSMDSSYINKHLETAHWLLENRHG